MLSFPALVDGARFLRRLPSFLRRRITHEEARATVAARFTQRAAMLLEHIESSILPFPEHPCRRLLEHAGCERGDVRRMLDEHGVEGALLRLFRAGVYLTGDEAKGRRPVVRGSLQFTIEAGQLANRRVAQLLELRSSGSSGAPTSAFLDLDSLLERAANLRLVVDARGGQEWPMAAWGTAGAAVTATNLRLIITRGRPLDAWFPITKDESSIARLPSLLGEPMIALACRSQGYRLPAAHYSPPQACGPILDWLVRMRARGATPHLAASPTSALRLCEAAGQVGVDLDHTKMLLRGEPLTETRDRILRAAGVDAHTLYGSAETNVVGTSCLQRSAVDEIHLMDDLFGVIQPGAGHASLPAEALLLTPLAPLASLIVLNLSMGDSAVLAGGSCGCPLEDYGWLRRAHTLRSFEKLVGAGMTFVDSDIVRILEQTLPQRFGGGAADYQVVEEEQVDGIARISLVIDPQVGAIDEQAVVDTFLAALAEGGISQQRMSQVWRASAMVRVLRRTPQMTAGGKVLHFYARRTAS